MCGLSVFVSKSCEETALVGSLKLMEHRGPDSSSFEIFRINDYYVGLGHNRLSIVDLSSTANQPMFSSCGKYILVYNGEIYNTLFLKSRLKSYSPFSTSDSEVLLQYFIEFGIDGLSDLNGMFAAVILDRENKEIYVFRDRAGIKPIYFSSKNNELFITSEVKGLRPFVGELEVQEDCVYEFFRLGYLLEPHTGFKDIYKVEPGTCMVFNLESEILDERRYSFNCIVDDNIIPDLKEVSEYQLISDVKSGIFFSAGRDSTALASVLPGTDLLYFCNDINEKGHDLKSVQRFSELTNRLVERYNVEKKILDIFEIADFIAEKVEEPISDFTFYSQFMIARAARDGGYKVMLSGMGADEVFFGYPRFKALKYRRLLNFLRTFSRLKVFRMLFLKFSPNKGERLYEFLFAKSFLRGYASITGYFGDLELSKLLLVEHLNSGRLRFDSVIDSLEMQYVDLNDLQKAFYFEKLGFLSHNLLVADKATMLQSIETRVPFLDNAYLIYTENIVRSNRIAKIFDKKIINDILHANGLEFIVNRPKEGFNINLIQLVKTKSLQDYTNFFNSKAEKFYLFVSPSYIENMLNDHFNKQIDRSYRIWQLVFFKSWISLHSVK